MTENENEIIDSTNDTEITENNEEIEIDLEEVEEEETITIPKKKWTEALAQKDHWKTKANKPAETKEVKTETKSDGVSTKDLYALMNAKVSEDDIDKVTKYAKFEGISIAEALKTPEMKAILSVQEEMRNSALVANTGKTRVGNSKISDDALLVKAMKGEMPQTPEEIARLTRIRKGIN